MKLLFCLQCTDIIAPLPTPNVPRYCQCGEHAVWWIDPVKGVLRVWSKHGARDKAFVLGLHNRFLTMAENADPKVSIKVLLEETPAYYLFKTWDSPIVRIRPGGSSDTAFADELPDGAKAERVPGPSAPLPKPAPEPGRKFA